MGDDLVRWISISILGLCRILGDLEYYHIVSSSFSILQRLLCGSWDSYWQASYFCNYGKFNYLESVCVAGPWRGVGNSFSVGAFSPECESWSVRSKLTSAMAVAAPDLVAFKWGEKVAGSMESYESLRFEGVWYSLYDCVFVRPHFDGPDHIGKLVRLYEERGVRKVRIRWFFRVQELSLAATKVLPKRNPKELFIAHGRVRGVENENVVGVIVRKATVLCTAKCPGNPLPSQHHLNHAHYFFNKVYDAANKKLVRIEKIEKSLAARFFNKLEWLSEKSKSEPARSPTSVRDFEVTLGRSMSLPSSLRFNSSSEWGFSTQFRVEGRFPTAPHPKRLKKYLSGVCIARNIQFKRQQF